MMQLLFINGRNLFTIESEEQSGLGISLTISGVLVSDDVDGCRSGVRDTLKPFRSEKLDDNSSDSFRGIAAPRNARIEGRAIRSASNSVQLLGKCFILALLNAAWVTSAEVFSVLAN